MDRQSWYQARVVNSFLIASTTTRETLGTLGSIHYVLSNMTRYMVSSNAITPETVYMNSI